MIKGDAFPKFHGKAAETKHVIQLVSAFLKHHHETHLQEHSFQSHCPMAKPLKFTCSSCWIDLLHPFSNQQANISKEIYASIRHIQCQGEYQKLSEFLVESFIHNMYFLGKLGQLKIHGHQVFGQDLVAQLPRQSAMETPLSHDLYLVHEILSLKTPGQLGGHQSPLAGQVKQEVVLGNEIKKKYSLLVEVVAQLCQQHIVILHQFLKMSSLSITPKPSIESMTTSIE